MKKLLLVSAIVFGSASIASAQAADQLQPAQSKPAKATKAVPAQKQKEAAATNRLAAARPTISNAAGATAPAPAKKVSIRKAKPVAAAKN